MVVKELGSSKRENKVVNGDAWVRREGGKGRSCGEEIVEEKETNLTATIFFFFYRKFGLFYEWQFQ